MNVLVIGCGKVGSCLANYMSTHGHDVAIVDKNRESFDMLDDAFTGYTVEGIPIDQDVLKRAGILGCDALAAVSQDDNVNIMVSQLALEVFHVPKVIARIYDPQRKDVFSHFGLRAICPTNLTVEAVYSMLLDTNETEQLTIDTSVIGFDIVPVVRAQVGTHVSAVEPKEGDVLFGVLHEDGAMELKDLCQHLRLTAKDRLVFAKIVD